jgi:hypothetical protein
MPVFGLSVKQAGQLVHHARKSAGYCPEIVGTCPGTARDTAASAPAGTEKVEIISLFC